MKVSIVSASRRPGFPHLGHGVVSHSWSSASGDPPSSLNFTFSGSSTGRSSSGTGTMPQSSQYTTGIGAPQYRCLEISQSRSRKFTSRSQ